MKATLIIQAYDQRCEDEPIEIERLNDVAMIPVVGDRVEVAQKFTNAPTGVYIIGGTVDHRVVHTDADDYFAVTVVLINLDWHDEVNNHKCGNGLPPSYDWHFADD